MGTRECVLNLAQSRPLCGTRKPCRLRRARESKQFTRGCRMRELGCARPVGPNSSARPPGSGRGSARERSRSRRLLGRAPSAVGPQPDSYLSPSRSLVTCQDRFSRNGPGSRFDPRDRLRVSPEHPRRPSERCPDRLRRSRGRDPPYEILLPTAYRQRRTVWLLSFYVARWCMVALVK